jgi:hypothetical protein
MSNITNTITEENRIKMKEKIVRIFGWISFVFYSIMALVTSLILIYENLDIYAISSLSIFVGMAFTGWNARNFELINFNPTRLKKVVAIFSLIFGCFFAIFSPYIFASSYGLGDSYEPIIVLIIMFLPSVITSIAILIKNKS